MSGENIQDVPLDTFSATFLAEIESLLNTQHEDRYLFAGSQTNTRAVDLSDAAYTPQAGLPGTFPADLGYYQGDTLQLSVRSAETFETTYGITAAAPAFEELLRADRQSTRLNSSHSCACRMPSLAPQTTTYLLQPA